MPVKKKTVAKKTTPKLAETYAYTMRGDLFTAPSLKDVEHDICENEDDGYECEIWKLVRVVRVNRTFSLEDIK